jgi:hypothetical protein
MNPGFFNSLVVVVVLLVNSNMISCFCSGFRRYTSFDDMFVDFKKAVLTNMGMRMLDMVKGTATESVERGQRGAWRYPDFESCRLAIRFRPRIVELEMICGA